MFVALHLLVYACLVVFVAAIAFRFHRIQSMPLHVRWELYPLPREGRRAAHGGSRLEESEWWDKKQSHSLVGELRAMLAEMVFIKGLWENNRRLWFRSFPFHFGLYILAAFAALLVFISALEELAGLPVGPSAGGIGQPLLGLARLMLAVGLALTLIGAVGLLAMRLSDPELKPYTTFAHLFNLLFIILALGVTAYAFLMYDQYLLTFREFVASLIVFDLAFETGKLWVAASIAMVALLVAYIPLTHMSHFFMKWFTWHRIRWDDAPNVKGGRIEKMIQDALVKPVTWSAEHINADGRKTWADIATEEVPKE